MSWLRNVPQTWTAVLTVVAILSMGASAGYTTREWIGYPSRLDKLEQDNAFLMTGFRYMTCRAVVQDEGGDPRVCKRVVQGMDEFMSELMGR